MRNFLRHAFLAWLLISSSIGFSQTPVYSSYPSAQAVIYLDFDGQLVENTPWNWAGPLSLNSSNLVNPQITEVFNRVAEDYRPFNVNVTTDSTKYWSAPIVQRIRVILTISSSWYGSAGGVAYVNSFTWGDNTPAFVFTALLGYNAKYIAEAASHEAGHALGLRHQSSYDGNCVKTAEYNAGTGNGEIAWAPIMGVGYYRNFTLWNNGANPYGCTSYQDDLSIITSSTNGFGYRSDDHSNNSNGAATAAVFSSTQFTVSGIIEKISDKDHFKFNMPINGQFKLNALPYNIGTGNVGSNLDMQVTLMSGNTVIGIYNPQSALNVFIDTFLTQGNYFIRVEGKGNTYAPEYASLGSYSLGGEFLPFGVLPVRRIELQGRKDKNLHQLNWIIDADEKVVKQEVEVSTDGYDFIQLGTFSTSARTFSYMPREKGNLQYRLHTSFENGAHYYSNTITLNNNVAAENPYLVSNLVKDKIMVNSPSAYNYMVTDYNGRMITKGRLTQGRNYLETTSLIKGMYIIQYENGESWFTEKFMKQ